MLPRRSARRRAVENVPCVPTPQPQRRKGPPKRVQEGKKRNRSPIRSPFQELTNVTPYTATSPKRRTTRAHAAQKKQNGDECRSMCEPRKASPYSKRRRTFHSDETIPSFGATASRARNELKRDTTAHLKVIDAAVDARSSETSNETSKVPFLQLETKSGRSSLADDVSVGITPEMDLSTLPRYTSALPISLFPDQDQSAKVQTKFQEASPPISPPPLARHGGYLSDEQQILPKAMDRPCLRLRSADLCQKRLLIYPNSKSSLEKSRPRSTHSESSSDKIELNPERITRQNVSRQGRNSVLINDGSSSDRIEPNSPKHIVPPQARYRTRSRSQANLSRENFSADRHHSGNLVEAYEPLKTTRKPKKTSSGLKQHSLSDKSELAPSAARTAPQTGTLDSSTSDDSLGLLTSNAPQLSSVPEDVFSPENTQHRQQCSSSLTLSPVRSHRTRHALHTYGKRRRAHATFSLPSMHALGVRSKSPSSHGPGRGDIDEVDGVKEDRLRSSGTDVDNKRGDCDADEFGLDEDDPCHSEGMETPKGHDPELSTFVRQQRGFWNDVDDISLEEEFD